MRRQCAEISCGDVPTLRVEITDGVGSYDIAFACSGKHITTFMRATAHLNEGWFPYEIKRTIRRIEPDPEQDSLGLGLEEKS